jgi:hypothetical protein
MVLGLGVLLACCCVNCSIAEEGCSGCRWEKSDTSVALRHADQIVWRFHFDLARNVPYFDPLAPRGGPSITWNAPPDHPWHHGLWFSWKYINGVNYWEHQGREGRPAGRTRWSNVEIQTHDDFSASIAMQVAYQAAGESRVVLREWRRIEVAAPDAQGDYAVDWNSRFQAEDTAVTLDRSAPQEKSAGGYAGLSVRFAEGLAERELMTPAGPVSFNDGDRYRGSAVAVDYSGVLPGGIVGVAFLDDARNPRHPTSWYAIRTPEVSYVNAALLTDEPLELQPQEQLTLRYRLVVHHGRWDAERLQRTSQSLIETKVEP